MFVCSRKSPRAEHPERGARPWLLCSCARGSTPWPLSLCWAEQGGTSPEPVPSTAHPLARWITPPVGWSHQQPLPGLCLPQPCALAMLDPEHRDCPGMSQPPAGIGLGSGRVRCPGAAEGLMQCACSCSAGNVAHLPGEARVLHGLAPPCQALISTV